MEPSKKMVEESTIALYMHSEGNSREEWDDETKEFQDLVRGDATACLRAALGAVKTVYVADCDDSGSARMHADGRDVDFSMCEGDTLAVIRGGE